MGGVRPRSSATLSIPYRPWMPGNPAGEHESAAVGLHGKALAPNADAMRQQPCLLSLGSLALDPNATGACSVKQSPKGVPAGSAIGTRDPALEDVSSGFTAPAPRRPQRLFRHARPNMTRRSAGRITPAGEFPPSGGSLAHRWSAMIELRLVTSSSLCGFSDKSPNRRVRDASRRLVLRARRLPAGCGGPRPTRGRRHRRMGRGFPRRDRPHPALATGEGRRSLGRPVAAGRSRKARSANAGSGEEARRAGDSRASVFSAGRPS